MVFMFEGLEDPTMRPYEVESHSRASGSSAGNQPPGPVFPEMARLARPVTSGGERVLMLPDDAEIVAVVELPESVQKHIEAANSDFVVLLRAAEPQVIDASAAILLAQFWCPKTMIDAIFDYSRKIGVRPSDALKYAFPVIQRFILAGVLLRCGDASVRS